MVHQECGELFYRLTGRSKQPIHTTLLMQGNMLEENNKMIADSTNRLANAVVGLRDLVVRLFTCGLPSIFTCPCAGRCQARPDVCRRSGVPAGGGGFGEGEPLGLRDEEDSGRTA